MHITILSIGKFENSPHRLVFENYLKRLKWRVELKEFDLKNSQNFSVEKIKTGEGELILKALRPGSKLIALDENARQFKSTDFAKLLADSAVNGSSNISFAIGGSNGLSQEVLNKAALKISFGLMTFPHLMVRALLAEQLYRASTIIDNHPYHKN
jgi:23S rRNA (pseudouridine1915-N3)-methyltransferase